MKGVSTLLRDMHENYAASIGVDPKARYIHGTPLRPVVPLDVGIGGVLIVGAYPSARFSVIDGVSDVPVADNLGPFEYERWFDGRRIREQPSARELRALFLEPLGINRSDCWITDLVKVFLFKRGHMQRYERLGASVPTGYGRERFYDLAQRSLPWLVREIELVKPKLIITLGAEVAGVLRAVTSPSGQRRLLKAGIEPLVLESRSVPAIHCAHPGILMRPGETNPWPKLHAEKFVPVVKKYLEELAHEEWHC